MCHVRRYISHVAVQFIPQLHHEQRVRCAHANMKRPHYLAFLCRLIGFDVIRCTLLYPSIPLENSGRHDQVVQMQALIWPFIIFLFYEATFFSDMRYNSDVLNAYGII